MNDGDYSFVNGFLIGLLLAFVYIVATRLLGPS